MISSTLMLLCPLEVVIYHPSAVFVCRTKSPLIIFFFNVLMQFTFGLGSQVLLVLTYILIALLIFGKLVIEAGIQNAKWLLLHLL
jgi:hypothetical protein